jgi:hypothetical protein
MQKNKAMLWRVLHNAFNTNTESSTPDAPSANKPLQSTAQQPPNPNGRN